MIRSSGSASLDKAVANEPSGGAFIFGMVPDSAVSRASFFTFTALGLGLFACSIVLNVKRWHLRKRRAGGLKKNLLAK